MAPPLLNTTNMTVEHAVALAPREFNIVGCDVGSVNGNADLCGCDWRNNDLLFETRTGRTECTPCKDFSEAKQKKR